MKRNPNSLNNLIPITSATASDLGRKGGYNKAKNERKRKTLKELAQAIIGSKYPEEKIAELREAAPYLDLEDDDITVGAAMLLCQIDKAIKEKDTKAFEIIRDTAGEKPVDKVETTAAIGVGQDLDKIKKMRDALGGKKRIKTDD